MGALKKAGITVAIGTDGAGSNNDNDMLEAMKFGALLQKTFHKDPQAMTAGQTLRMATIDGAKALGMEKQIGSIEVGKKRISSSLIPQRAPNHVLSTIL